MDFFVRNRMDDSDYSQAQQFTAWSQYAMPARLTERMNRLESQLFSASMLHNKRF